MDLPEFLVKQKNQGFACGIALADMTPEQREKFNAAMADRTISARAIAEVLQDWGFPVRDQTVRRHRVGTCRCPRD